MNKAQAPKILAVLLAVSIILTVALAAVQNNSQPKIAGTSVAVPPANLVWAKTYGALGDDDRAYCALPTAEGYFVVGSSESNLTGTTVGWALMIDHGGNAVWNKTYHEGYGTELRWALNLTDGFLLVGNVFQPSGKMSGFAAKTDMQGNLVWSKTFGGNGTDEFYSAFAASDGYVLLGLTSQSGGAQPQAWVVKIDAGGNLIWDRAFSFASDTVAKTGVLSPDGDYVVGGYTDSKAPNEYSFLLMKISPDGSLIWSQTYGEAGSQEATSMTEASDGYVIVGNTQAPGDNMHAWVVKIDSNGALQWAKTVGGKDADSPAYVTSSGDGGFLVSGFTFSFGAGNRDFWLFKIDAAGRVVWSCTQGDPAYQEAYSAIQSGKDSCVMVGWTDPPGQTALIGRARYMFYVVEVNIPKASRGFSSLQLALYGLAALDVLLAALLVMSRLQRKRALTTP